MTKKIQDVSNLTMLIIDDDSVVRDTLREFLGSFGFARILEASNGAEGWGYLQKGIVDLVISDWEMPEMSGYELLQKVRKDPKIKAIPFIMITSPKSKERDKVERAVAAKVDSYLMKPFRAAALKERLDYLLSPDRSDKIPEELQELAYLDEKDDRSKICVLVVEDSLATRATVVEYLREMGYGRILEADNGRQGFQILKQHQDEVDIVISDWEMPEMAGIDLLKRIRADRMLRNKPFIMITSQQSIERIKLKRAIEGSVNHYLLKPFKMNDLKNKIKNVMEQYKRVERIDEELTQAHKYLEEQRWEQAQESFESALNLDRTNTDALFHLGKLAILSGARRVKAIDFFERTVKIDPSFEEAYLELANAHESARSLVKAISSLKKGLTECRLSHQIHYHLGRLYLLVGRRTEGVEELKRALDLKPGFEEAAMLLSLQEGRMLAEDNDLTPHQKAIRPTRK